jgi:serine/threonine-protein kinase
MSVPDDQRRSGVNAVLAERINMLRERYEAEWLVAEKGGPEPSIERFLQDTPEPERPLVEEALSQIDQLFRSRRSSASMSSIPNDLLPTAIGWAENESGPTFAPTVQLPIPRHAPTLPPTQADEPRSSHGDGSGSFDETLEPTMPATRAGATVSPSMAPTIGMDASGVTVEHDSHPEVRKPKARAKGPREAPKVDGYEILGELGRGGMGVVYKARHLKLDRIVALKMVLAGAHASESQLDRFILEAQAVARLQHPDIVQVFEVGEHDGLPYFSLEFVEGGTLAHKIAGKPMPPRSAAEMALILAGAMQVAHKKNIIHRDLKPANILLTTEGLPKITDFGLAKKLEDEDSHQTRSGAIMGTPSYMSPEQAWGETDKIGPLADQYALGAMLYEMLTGRPPFQGTTPLDTLEQVRSQDPIPPSRLLPKVPKDLETICLKALQKETKKRYADCEGLASDLQRYLDNKPILARPVSNFEKARRWAQRNQRVAFLSAAVVALLISATGVMTYSYYEILGKNKVIEEKNKIAVEARRRAEIGEKEAKKQTAIAVANARKADDQSLLALDTMVRTAGIVQRNLRNRPDMQQLRYEFVREVADSMDRVEVRTSTKKGIPLLRAGVHQQLGMIQKDRGIFQDALKETQRAEQCIEEEYRSDPGDPFLQGKVAAVKNLLGDLHHYQFGNVDLARSYYREALKLRKRIAESYPSDINRIDVANNIGLVAMCTLKLGDPEAARKLFLEELDHRNRLTPEYVRDNPEARRELSGLYDKLGETSMKLGEPLKAQEFYDKSFEIRAQIASDPATKDSYQAKMDLANAMNNYGTLNLMELKDPKSARKYHQQAVEVYEVLRRENPESVMVAQNLSFTYYCLATAALRMGERDTSDANYRKCLELRRQLATGPEAKNFELDLIIALARCGEHEEAGHRMDALLKSPPQDNQVYYQAACAYALSAGAVARDKPKDQQTETERTAIETYTAKALDALRHLIANNFRSLGDLKIDPDLDPIRDDPRFQAILDELERKLAAAPK